MKNQRKRFAAICLSLLIFMTGCGAKGQQEQSDSSQSADTTEEVTLQIAYQYGIAYAPLIVAKEQKLIESAYEERTGNHVTVVWNQMSSGPDINAGISSGNIDVGFLGVAPAITGIMKGVGYKIFTSVSGQEHALMTNDEGINSISDLVGSSDQIALVNIGSIQHIILAKTLEEQGVDPHALDSNIVAMKHPDGMTALESKNVACQLTTSPYLYQEREEEGLHELSEVADTWKKDDSFVVGVASEELYKEDPDLYQALCDAMTEAVAYVNDNMEETAKLTSVYDGTDEADEFGYLQTGTYNTETKGVLELAEFMAKNGFIEKAPASYSDLVFDNVNGD